jgi:LysM repeat protein
VDRICPLLAMAGDRRTVCDGFDPDHRCWSASPPPVLDRAQQLDVCLTAAHTSCPYRAVPAAGVDQLPVDQRISPSRLVVEPDGAWLGLASRSVAVVSKRRMLAAAATVVAAGVLATASGGLGAVGGFAADLQQASSVTAAVVHLAPESPKPTATPSESPASTPQPIAIPSVELTPVPTASPVAVTPSPASTPTPAPSVPQPRGQRYVVQPGDTLSRIADRFGVSVQALQQANGIADQDVITVGQTLIIPAA